MTIRLLFENNKILIYYILQLNKKNIKIYISSIEYQLKKSYIQKINLYVYHI